MLPNASYFAFTATPKNKTLEIFGEPFDVGRRDEAPAVPQLHDEAGDPGGLHPRRARELHAGRQLLQAVKTVEDDPEFDTKRAQKKLRALRREQRPRDPAQGRDHGRPLPRAGDRAATRSAAQARAMVVTSGIERAIQYYHAIERLPARAQEPVSRRSSRSPASTSTTGKQVTEASLNGFP